MSTPKNKKRCNLLIINAFFVSCDPDWIRTNDPHLRRMTLYPAELPNHYGLQIKGKNTKLPPLI